MPNVLQAPAATDTAHLLELAKDVLDIEARAVDALKARLGKEFLAAHAAVRALEGTNGRVVVMGMGKSGHIASKIAATLASTGTPAFFVHPAEASHGDLGMITKDDVVIAISYSGESGEILAILPLLKRRGATIIAMTGRARSTLAREADVHLDVAVEKEACPLELAPTASTTATLALGDALAMALLDSKGFRSEDFAQHHPGGALGRKLLVHVSDIMRKGDQLPINKPDDSLAAAILEMSAKGIGMTAIVDPGMKLIGIFTDGDLRRVLEKHDSIKTLRVGDVMTKNPRTIAPEKLAAEAAQVLEKQSLGGRLVAVDPEGRLVGALTFHDLLAEGII
ncbi:KpsF/GutQ family sugar-phosphate isomerase [Usitatibacter palustris]|uniref:Arabinose 5-phosphate isomerase KdsD n=1 Tax=Usitatibacter palustris TaxID=2732487 RepID=A0A6M4H468_9PROT|nr:KpsF/GutQ family sugar-phosphate isomerase [Usitatibacter palustris]QJR13284.1 Arabinose 5-phosphate isomerase KdsD [Usitatibacter palustris]